MIVIGDCKGRGEQDGAATNDSGEEDESLSIINESDFSPLARSFLSQLTTPRATPLLSPQTPSPRSSWSAGPQILLKPHFFGTGWSDVDGLPWSSTTAPASRLTTPGPANLRLRSQVAFLPAANLYRLSPGTRQRPSCVRGEVGTLVGTRRGVEGEQC